MHGLVNRAVQCFVRDTYGAESWNDVVQQAGLEFSEFEAMLHYDDAITHAIVNAVTVIWDLPRDTLLEDIGTYLVTHPNVDALRRLLRFGGDNFLEFLQSLDDLEARAKLAVDDLDLPKLELHDHGGNVFRLTCEHSLAGFAFVVLGVLRTMADDYGALALLEYTGRVGDTETILITLVEESYSDGRDFDFGGRVA